ncbi:hypothetical protein GCM10019059_39740 [Camelimonas fluminis]|uniref:TrbC/VIRB2 family protein n=1 Tax=Camelimonas fluminis TaxID=1576911 RepID=A0ABV7UFG0_9HYPH|nr:hypothetical protein [Camelimonas fluminis]GHE76526.1 hypothetical protein GCM10019059_39740 [Camelimonas fluminis]
MRTNALVAIALALLVVAFALHPDIALAQTTPSGGSGTGVFSTLQTKGTTTFSNVRIIMFIIGGFGFIGIAGMAFFGRFDWKWIFSTVGGLMMLAAAGGILYYATHTESGSTIGDSIGGMQEADTLR